MSDGKYCCPVSKILVMVNKYLSRGLYEWADTFRNKIFGINFTIIAPILESGAGNFPGKFLPENSLPHLFLQPIIPAFPLPPPLPHPDNLFQKPPRLHTRPRKHALFHPPWRFNAPGDPKCIGKRPLQPVS